MRVMLDAVDVSRPTGMLNATREKKQAHTTTPTAFSSWHTHAKMTEDGGSAVKFAEKHYTSSVRHLSLDIQARLRTQSKWTVSVEGGSVQGD